MNNKIDKTTSILSYINSVIMLVVGCLMVVSLFYDIENILKEDISNMVARGCCSILYIAYGVLSCTAFARLKDKGIIFRSTRYLLFTLFFISLMMVVSAAPAFIEYPWVSFLFGVIDISYGVLFYFYQKKLKIKELSGNDYIFGIVLNALFLIFVGYANISLMILAKGDIVTILIATIMLLPFIINLVVQIILYIQKVNNDPERKDKEVKPFIDDSKINPINREEEK